MRDKVVLITGAGKGIGRQLAEDLLSKGAFIICLTRSKKDLKDLRNNKNCKIFYGDVSNTKIINNIFKFSEKEGKIINSLVNNAGMRQRKKFQNLKNKEIYKVFETNFFSIFRLMQIFLKFSLKHKIKSSIVNIGSIVGENGFAELSGYGATKAALKNLTKSFAVEFANKGIRANIVNPGFSKTSYFKNFKNNKKLYNWTLSRIPQKRWAEPNEVVPIIEFLISNESSYMTGESINIDGGWLSS